MQKSFAVRQQSNYHFKFNYIFDFLLIQLVNYLFPSEDSNVIVILHHQLPQLYFIRIFKIIVAQNYSSSKIVVETSCFRNNLVTACRTCQCIVKCAYYFFAQCITRHEAE